MKYANDSTSTNKYAVSLMFFVILIITAMAVTSTSTASTSGVGVTVNGLENGDVISLRLMPELEGNGVPPVLLEQSVQANGQNSLLVNIPINVSDGYYKLILEGSSKYFRDPKGYLFQVSQQQIVNPTNRSFVFDLLLSTTQSYPTCTDAQMNGESNGEAPINDEPVCQAERMISFSAPVRQPISQQSETPSNTGYHWFGPYTTQDAKGVRSRFTVVNPAVCHSNCIGYMFALDHVYAQYLPSGGTQIWMEAGWAETSWWTNNRYIFQYNSTDRSWDTYGDPISDGTQLRVRVRNLSGNTWRAERYSSASGWILLREVNIGFSTAQSAFNKGEVYTDDASWHPGFPSSTFNEAYLLINGIWEVWNTRYYTVNLTASPYDAHITTSYTLFCVHYHSSSNCTP